MKTMAVYCIRNSTNGKRYVGSTTNLEWRWALHRRQLKKGSHHSTHLQRAWGKYGPEAFEFEILEEITDQAILVQTEQRYMDLFGVCDPSKGYNTAKEAGSNAGNRMSPEARARISAAMKGRKFTEEHKAKIAAASRAQRHTPETKAKLRQLALQRPLQEWQLPGHEINDETRRKIGDAHRGDKNHWFGKHLSEETRAKISAKNIGNTHGLGHHHSDDTRARLREMALVRERGKRVSGVAFDHVEDGVRDDEALAGRFDRGGATGTEAP